jgi:uncharacterized protein YbjT (DUF2867 family)
LAEEVPLMTHSPIPPSGIAFVAGATGYTGQAVVKQLRGRGIETVAHVRPDSSKREHFEKSFGEIGAQVDLTPWEAAAMTQTMAQLRPDHVFALLGTTRDRRSREDGGVGAGDYRAVDYGLTALLMDACLAAQISPRFIYLSSAGVQKAPGAYAEARRLAEAKLKASGLPHVIARPGMIHGADREEKRLGEALASTLIDGAAAMAGMLGAKKLSEKVASMDSTTLAAGLVAAAYAEEGGSQEWSAAELRAAQGPSGP